MPRWVFAALVAAGCVLYGVLWARSLTRRAASLQAWGRALARLEAGLGYRAETLSEWLECAAAGEECTAVRHTLTACAEQMRASPLLSLREAINANTIPDITPADRTALSPLWDGLGNGDEAAQRALLRSVRTALDAQTQQAKEKEKEDVRLALSLGVLGGGAVFLFLL